MVLGEEPTRAEVIMSAKTKILGSLAWAAAMIVSAYLLKGTSASSWVWGALYASWTTFILWDERPARCRRRNTVA